MITLIVIASLISRHLIAFIITLLVTVSLIRHSCTFIGNGIAPMNGYGHASIKTHPGRRLSWSAVIALPSSRHPVTLIKQLLRSLTPRRQMKNQTRTSSPITFFSTRQEMARSYTNASINYVMIMWMLIYLIILKNYVGLCDSLLEEFFFFLPWLTVNLELLNA